LQPTALLHEAYLRLIDKTDVAWESRRHFFFAAARAMRDFLVEQARRKARPVRGGDRRRQELDEACAVIEPPPEDVLAVHEALDELEKQDPVKAQIVLLRYFSGLTTAETAEVLGLAERTLDRQWRYIRAWLLSNERSLTSSFYAIQRSLERRLAFLKGETQASWLSEEERR
jgi:RNA polymerase sigma factor (TIGR02999 family)